MNSRPPHEWGGSCAARIPWDPAFGTAHFRLAGGLVHGDLREPFLREGEPFSVILWHEKGEPHEVPLHRIREVWRDGALIWRRPWQLGSDPIPPI